MFKRHYVMPGCISTHGSRFLRAEISTLNGMQAAQPGIRDAGLQEPRLLRGDAHTTHLQGFYRGAAAEEAEDT